MPLGSAVHKNRRWLFVVFLGRGGVTKVYTTLSFKRFVMNGIMQTIQSLLTGSLRIYHPAGFGFCDSWGSLFPKFRLVCGAVKGSIHLGITVHFRVFKPIYKGRLLPPWDTSCHIGGCPGIRGKRAGGGAVVIQRTENG